MDEKTQKILEDVLKEFDGLDIQETMASLALALMSNKDNCKTVLGNTRTPVAIRNVSGNIPFVIKELGLLDCLKEILLQQMYVVDDLANDDTAWSRDQILSLYRAFAGFKGFSIHKQ